MVHRGRGSMVRSQEPEGGGCEEGVYSQRLERMSLVQVLLSLLSLRGQIPPTSKVDLLSSVKLS